MAPSADQRPDTEALLALTATLVDATTPSAIAEALAEHSIAIFGATWSEVWLSPSDADALVLIASRGRSSSASLAPHRVTPVAVALRGREPLWIEAETRRNNPIAEGLFADANASPAIACLPLDVAGNGAAVALLGFDGAPSDSSIQRVASLLARQARRAIGRTLLLESMRIDSEQLLDEARAAVWLRDDFLGIAGHELKTPITALQLGLQSLVRSPGEREATVKRIALCHRQVERLSKLVDELLDVSRITAGRLALELEEVDLAAVAEDVVTRMADDFAKAACEVVLTTDGPILGRWDRMRLDQIVTNFLSNAVKYGKGRPIAVNVGRTPRGAALSVSDEGIGIAEEDQRRIFDRFERAVSHRNYGGLGLGLWIVRQIVETLGGSVYVRSAMGSGACFSFEIPFVPPDAAVALR